MVIIELKCEFYLRMDRGNRVAHRLFIVVGLIVAIDVAVVSNILPALSF